MKDHLVIAYHSFNDPIFKGLLLRYLQKFHETALVHRFHVITFEQTNYLINKDEHQQIKSKLRDSNIVWHPLRYHSGGVFILFKKLWDFFVMFLLVARIAFKVKLNYVVGFTTLSGIMAYFISIFIQKKVIVLNIEPHSEYMKDFNIWSKSGLNYRLLRYLEDKMIRHGDHVVFPTMNGYNLWKDTPTKNKFYFVPTCIELDDFYFDERSRAELREKLGIDSGTKVILYLGKFGGIYYSMKEAARTFKSISKQNEKTFFYILTPDSTQALDNEMKQAGFLEYQYSIKGKVPYEDLSKHLSVGDFGILLIPPYPSQKYRCPIKTANYLACGLPYLITDGIGDDSELAKSEKLGQIVGGETSQKIDFTTKSREFYRKKAIEHRDISIMTKFLGKILETT